MAQPTIPQIVEAFQARIGGRPPLGGTIKFDFGDKGSVLIDGTAQANTVVDGAGKAAETTVIISLENFVKLVAGEFDGSAAFARGDLKIAGDMGNAIKMVPILMQ